MASPLEQGKEIWGRLQTTQRLLVAGAALATLGLIATLVYTYTGEDYGLLFSELKPNDAQAIVEKLKTANVSYKLTNNGTSISVPGGRVAELRLQMASSGLLSGGHVGFDIFDKTSFGATDFAQQVNYQRALEGELGRTLEGMEEVESARVHITRSRESVFTEKAEKAKASVMLRVRQGRDMARERTATIVGLVASAVEGLDPADVSVMDTRGRLLTTGSGPNDAGAFNSHLDAKRRFEAETAARVVALLEPISGVGHVRADVAADVDFSKIEQTEEKYDPKSTVVRTQQNTQESRNNANRNPAGLVGARANDPSAAPTPAVVTTPPANSGDNRTATTTNYEIDRLIKHTIGNGGRIARLSVSVVVDYKNSNGTVVARQPDELQKLQELVGAAVGLDTQRGDQIVVQSFPFDQPPVENANQSWLQRNREMLPLFVKYGVLLVIVVLFVFFLLRPAKKALLAALAPPPPALLLPAETTGETVAEAAAALSAAEEVGTEEKPPIDTKMLSASKNEEFTQPLTVAEMEAAMNAQDAQANNNGEEIEEINPIIEIKQELLARVKENPELIAMTMRGWLNDEA